MTSPNPDSRRATAALLIGTAALSVFGMAHHPTGHGHGRTLLESLVNIAPLAMLVHAALLAVMLAQLIGQAGLASRLGPQRLVVQGAFVAQLAGALALAGAAVINGFTLSPMAQSMLAAGYTAPEQYRPLLWALFAQARAWAQIGTAAWAVALVLWALAVWPRHRPLALLALPLVLVPMAGGLGLLPLDVIGFGAVVLAQAIWAAAAGLLLWRNRL
ncbi:hypothetical protein CAP39_00330 [Sphingomonas sp. IBVSS1]|nr:hypothetical protein CAP39_00330 [Sphingomonas sp. IBVSS1]